MAAQAVLGLTADGLITHANAEAEQIFGYRWDELVGQRLHLLVPDLGGLPVSADGVAVDRIVEGLQVRAAGRRKDGTTFPAGVIMSKVDSDRGLVIAASLRDLSVDARLSQARDLLGAVTQSYTDAAAVAALDGLIGSFAGEPAGLPGSGGAGGRSGGGFAGPPGPSFGSAGGREVLAGPGLDSLGRLAAGIGHNFNNLLAIISAHTSMLAEELAAHQPHSRHTKTWLADLTHIQRAVDRAAAQTRQLLTFGRRGSAQPVPLDLCEHLREAGTTLGQRVDDSVRLNVHTDDTLWPVSADPTQIEQVLLNLTANAYDAMPHGGRIDIEAANVTLPEEPGRFVRIQVRDTGTGIGPEALARVFEPFFSTKPAGEAGGMGLAIVHGAVSEAGGRVTIDSTPGMGTTVTVLLPATDRQPVLRDLPTAAPEPGAPPSAGGTILIIEDEDDLRGAVQRMLTGSGYQILVATDGMDAIRLAATHPGPIDVLLSDVVMPEMSGPDVADEIREIRPGVRVVFMSGYDQPFLASRGRLAVELEVLQKPFSRELLLATLRQVVAR